MKPTSANCGRGIRLVQGAVELRRECFGDSPDTNNTNPTPAPVEGAAAAAAAAAVEDGSEGEGQGEAAAVAPPAPAPAAVAASEKRLPTLNAAVAQRYVSNPLLLGAWCTVQ